MIIWGERVNPYHGFLGELSDFLDGSWCALLECDAEDLGGYGQIVRELNEELSEVPYPLVQVDCVFSRHDIGDG